MAADCKTTKSRHAWDQAQCQLNMFMLQESPICLLVSLASLLLHLHYLLDNLLLLYEKGPDDPVTYHTVNIWIAAAP